MKFTPSSLPEVLIIEPDVYGDNRGFLFESWKKSEYLEAGIETDFVQDNHSHSIQGVLRGIHYQIQQPQGKLIRAVRGEIFDVAVDLRKSSRTFGKWVGEHLSEENNKMLWVPPGFAHGFYVVSNMADVCYKCTDYYAPGHERTLLWNDPDLAIHWPMVDDRKPLLSVKDSQGKLLREAEVYEKM